MTTGLPDHIASTGLSARTGVPGDPGAESFPDTRVAPPASRANMGSSEWPGPPSGPEPGGPTPLARPGTPDSGEWLRRQLFDRRVLLVSGVLDEATATEVAASVMTLDALGDDPIRLNIDSPEGAVGAALALMDVIDLCGVPVHGTGLGLVAGPAVGVLAVCARRTLSPHARLRLVEPRANARGSATELQALAQSHLDQWTAFCRRLSAATGQAAARVREDAAAGRFFSAEEALAYGLVDEVAAPDANLLRLPGRRIGFGPEPL